MNKNQSTDKLLLSLAASAFAGIFAFAQPVSAADSPGANRRAAAPRRRRVTACQRALAGPAWPARRPARCRRSRCPPVRGARRNQGACARSTRADRTRRERRRRAGPVDSVPVVSYGRYSTTHLQSLAIVLAWPWEGRSGLRTVARDAVLGAAC